jgi:starvation-inducible outer membrane lipoprotein
MKKFISILAVVITMTACSSAPKVAEQQYQPQPTVVVIHAGPQPYYAPPPVQYYSIPGKYYHNPALPRY